MAVSQLGDSTRSTATCRTTSSSASRSPATSCANAGSPNDYADRVVATGFLAIARRFGHDIDKDMHLTHEDMIDTMGKVFLGLSLGCARCHAHKYDPISAEDYYALYGIFESTKFSFPGCEPNQQPHDLVPLMPGQRVGIEPLTSRVEVAYAVTEGTPRNARLQLARRPGKTRPRGAAALAGSARRPARSPAAPAVVAGSSPSG